MFQTKMISDESGFTLTEILTALVIVGILTVLAFSKFDLLITNTKMIEAKTNLKHLYTLEEMYKQMYDKYSDDFAIIGFEAPKLITEDGDAKYKIEIVKADLHSFEATATAVVDFDNDGVFNQWKVDQSGKITQVVAD
jgi:type IV pilus assembly protein PilE